MRHPDFILLQATSTWYGESDPVLVWNELAGELEPNFVLEDEFDSDPALGC
jgi:hypothetical protein